MEKTVNIPFGVEVKIEGGIVSVSGPKGELKREIKAPKMEIRQEEGKIMLISADERKKNTSILGTWSAHLENMIKGVTKGWEARMNIVYSHFPIKLSVEGDTVTISNFLGERGSRKTKIIGGSTVKLEKDSIVITGIDKEAVGQTAANIELASRVKDKDRRVFQDGCYITQKPIPIGEKK